MKNFARQLLAAAAACGIAAASPAVAQRYSERPAKLGTPDANADYIRRTVDIPMRDGINPSYSPGAWNGVGGRSVSY